MTLAALLCAGVAAAASPVVAGPGQGLTVPAAGVLEPGRQSLQVLAMFRGNYPILGAGFSEGLPGGLELAGAGGFEHARVDWPGAGGRLDADEFQGALRWGTPVGGAGVSGGLAIAAGFTKGYVRTRMDDGRYSFGIRRTVWGEAAAGAGVMAGARVTVVERWVRDMPSRSSVHATVFGVESPGWNGTSVVAEVGVFLRNPPRWKTPWAAGLRLPAGGQAVDFFFSNTRGVTVPGCLEGGTRLSCTFRLLLRI